MIPARAVAQELRLRRPEAGKIAINILLYYCQGWHLTWSGQAMFAEEIEAWEHGPVVPSLWSDPTLWGVATIEDFPWVPPNLSGANWSTVEWVERRYGNLSERDFIRLACAEDPWRDASRSGQRHPPLTNEALRTYFEADREYAIRRQMGLEAARLQRELGKEIAHAEPSGEIQNAEQLQERLRQLA